MAIILIALCTMNHHTPPPPLSRPFKGLQCAHLPLGGEKLQNTLLLNHRLAIAFAGYLINCHET